MKCTNCGHDLPDPKEGISIKFCPFCGARVLEAAAAAAPAAEVIKEEIAAEAAEAEKAADTVVEQFEELVEEASAEATEAAAETVAEAAEAAEAAQETAEETIAEAAEAVEAVREAAEEAADQAAETVAEAAETAEAIGESAAEATEAAAETAAEATEAVQETAAEATAAAAAASAIGVPPEVQPTAKKKSKAPLIIAIIVVILGVAGYFVYQNLPSTKVAKFKKQASELHTAGSYEAELDALKQAAELAPDDRSIITSQADAMLAQARKLLEDGKEQDAFTWYGMTAEKASGLSEDYGSRFYDSVKADIGKLSSDALSEGRYVDAEAYLNKRKEILSSVPGIEELTEADILNVYTKWTEDVLAGGIREDFDAQSDIIDLLIKDNKLPGKTAELNALKDKLFEAGMQADLKSIGASIKQWIDSDKPELATSQMYLALISSISKGNYIAKWVAEDPDHRSPVIGDIDGTNKIGLYYDKANNRLYTYIGQYDANNKRSGQGSWITYLGSALTTQTSYVAKGAWSDDKPNGDFSIYESVKSTSDSSQDRIKNTTVNVKNGLYEGESTVAYTRNENTIIYKPTYTDGHPKVIEDHEQGGTVYHIIAFSEDKKTFMHNAKGAEAIEGIYGFF